ncbi:uncharacterized protein LOC133911883 [Phragmites australis]|uniref:uncharacterized protein LOC133911883 n=1 Tax=Phragmites australis TaxID=29695 RepID=UPI002D7701B4|nr:uncharacterized protein LOC133911883 [Phragmites australis]
MSKVLERSSLGVTTPTSSASPPKSKKHEKTVPHYLRASTGSCHDLCKYGHKNPSEEVPRFSGGRRKKLPTQLNNLTLHRSAILDRSKDVRNRSLSLAKSSISLGEAERVAPKITSANRKGVTSNEHLVLQTATSFDHKKLNSDGRNKHSMVAQKAPTNLQYSNGFPKFDQKATTPAKEATFGAKSRFPEKTLPGNSRNVDKVTTVKQSLLKRPASSPTKLNMIKHVPVSSQASSHHLFSKDKSTPKGKVTSPPATITRVRAKPGRSPTRSSNANINGKEGLDMSRSASVEIQEDDVQVTGYYAESTLAVLSSDATECIDNSRPAPEETSNSISEDAGMGSTEKSEVLAGETLQASAIALELQQSLDGQEFNGMLGESDPEHKLAEQNVVHGRASEDKDSQTDDPALCQLSEQLTAVENTDVYDPVLTESNSKIEDDQVKVNAPVESLIAEGKEEVGVHKFFERSPELVALDETHAEEPESCCDFASGNAAENDKADEVFDGRVNNCTSHCQSISETSSDVGLVEEPNSMQIEPSDSAVHELASVSNKNTFEHDGPKSRIFIPQSSEEPSDDEFYEEYDFELSESDESCTEDEEATINGSRDESLKAGYQRPIRISALELDNASITPYKLKFKRGKIVELPPDSCGPRRLKFRRKAANEVSGGESQPVRKIYRRNNTNNTVPANPDVESPGVKLRHQDTQEKKDAQGLFNNVIEETASKLVESRKSKVKALVGAFETVISLQDGKPTSSTQQASNSQDSVQDDEGNAPEEAE